MKTKDRQENRRHASRPEKDLIFAPPHFLKGTEMLTLNFLSRFLSLAPFSTFAAYIFLGVEKFTPKKILATPPAAKELNPTRKTKTPAKKFLPTHYDKFCKFENQNNINYENDADNIMLTYWNNNF